MQLEKHLKQDWLTVSPRSYVVFTCNIVHTYTRAQTNVATFECSFVHLTFDSKI